jgi:hypothetical protein
VDQEVAKTLGDLELKLAQLERELTSAGRREAPAEGASEQPEQAEQADVTIARAGKLIDEAIEQYEAARLGDSAQPSDARPSDTPPSSDAQARFAFSRPVEQSDNNTQSGPADGRPPIPAPFSPGPVFEKLEPPYPPHSQPPSPPHSPAVETRSPSEPPAPSRQPPAEQRQSIDIADLVRFRDKLARTMDELIAEYSQLLSLQPPGSSRPPDA